MKMKETFCSYMDLNDENWRKMNEEIEELKNELEKTRNIVRVQRVRYQQLVSLFSAKLQEKEEETRNELQMKHIQLTRILRVLYILESKLRKEQKMLKTSLLERDTLIRSQQVEITKLKNELEKASSRCTGYEDRSKFDLKSADNQMKTVSESKSAPVADNKPDLISSIGIELLNGGDNTNSRVKEFKPVSSKLENNEENTYVISSLDDYDATLSSLHVRGANEHGGGGGDDDDEDQDHNDGQTKEAAAFPQTGCAASDQVENNQNANNENICNRMIDEELQNEMRKFKMKEIVMQDEEPEPEEPFKSVSSSPRMILKEVTENPNEKLNGPVLKCVKQILSLDGGDNKFKDGKHPIKLVKPETRHCENTKTAVEKISVSSKNNGCCDLAVADTTPKRHPVKPPKPNFMETMSRYQQRAEPRNAGFETNVPNAFLFDNTLSVKPLPATIDRCQSKDLFGKDGKSSINGEEFKNDLKLASNDKSKIVQTVSALLSESAESEDEKAELSPTVSQMVKKFESLKSKKKILNKQTNSGSNNVSKSDNILFQTNFEEFHLVDKEIESTCEDIIKDDTIRLEAEGEENSVSSVVLIESTNSNKSSNAKYEAFLEVTGLSQKSILTPSRILSNHRSVVKPKDVKYRNRVKAAVFGGGGSAEKCNNGNTVTSPTTKYWTEPFL